MTVLLSEEGTACSTCYKISLSALYRKCSNVIPWDYRHITGLPNSNWQTQSEFSESEDTWDFISEII